MKYHYKIVLKEDKKISFSSSNKLPNFQGFGSQELAMEEGEKIRESLKSQIRDKTECLVLPVSDELV